MVYPFNMMISDSRPVAARLTKPNHDCIRAGRRAKWNPVKFIEGKK
jgi:hypothetical protein